MFWFMLHLCMEMSTRPRISSSLPVFVPHFITSPAKYSTGIPHGKFAGIKFPTGNFSLFDLIKWFTFILLVPHGQLKFKEKLLKSLRGKEIIIYKIIHIYNQNLLEFKHIPFYTNSNTFIIFTIKQ